MVELINHHHVERVWCDIRQVDLRQRLNGCEHVPPLLGLLTVDEQFAE